MAPEYQRTLLPPDLPLESTKKRIIFSVHVYSGARYHTWHQSCELQIPWHGKPDQARELTFYQTVVFGQVDDEHFQQCKRIVAEIETNPECGLSIRVEGLFPTDYDWCVKQHVKDDSSSHKDAVLFMHGDRCIGGSAKFVKWAEQNYDIVDQSNNLVNRRLARIGMQLMMEATGRSYISLGFVSGEVQLGELVIELYTDICPATCAHFMALASKPRGQGYIGSPIHRIVKNAFIQGGDIETGRGDSESLQYRLGDETCKVLHDRAGVLGMAKRQGERHSAATQFYITLSPLDYMNGKNVAFGRVVRGMRLLNLLQNDGPKGVPVRNQRPVQAVNLDTYTVVVAPAAALAAAKAQKSMMSFANGRDVSLNAAHYTCSAYPGLVPQH